MQKTLSEIFKQATMKVISAGAASVVYNNPDNQNLVIKKARDNIRNAKGRYISRQKRGFDIIDKIRESGQDCGVNLPEFISSVKSFDIDTNETPYQSVTETKLTGIELTNTKYFALSDKTKNKLASQLAKFMYTLHNMEKPRIATLEDRKQDTLYRFPNISKENLNKFIQQFKNKNLKQILTNAATVLWQEIGDDEIIVMTHGDLRWPNIVYDKPNEKLGVIDFEDAAPSHIYRDFISSPISFNWDFVQRIIKKYNNLRKINNNPIYINANKIKKLIICSVVNKIVRDTIDSESEKDIDNTEKYRNNLIDQIEQDLIHKLKILGLMDVTNNILYKYITHE